MRFVDAHTHLYEFGEREVEAYAADMLIIAVSDDPESSRRTMELGRKYSSVTPAVGIHPWEVGKHRLEEVEDIADLVDKGARVLGEIGLDKRFVPETYRVQQAFFQEFLDLAEGYDLVLNLHCAGAWRECFETVAKKGVERVVMHWYTGPLDLLEKIAAKGWYITVNPAVSIQAKMRRVVEKSPLEIILSESDGPYEYRGLRLTPPLVKNVVREVSRIKGTAEEKVAETILGNLTRLLH